MRLDQKAGDEPRQAHVGQEEMCDGQLPAVEWMAEEPREQLIADTEYQHRQKPGDVHVGVGWTVDDPRRVRGHPDAKCNPGGKPEQ